MSTRRSTTFATIVSTATSSSTRFPEAQPQWTVRRGAESLKAAMEANQSDRSTTSKEPRYMRLRHLQEIMATRERCSTILHWLDGVSA